MLKQINTALMTVSTAREYYLMHPILKVFVLLTTSKILIKLNGHESILQVFLMLNMLCNVLQMI